jgi:hypothetical protein
MRPAAAERLHRARPRGLKLCISFVLLLAALVWVSAMVRWNQLRPTDGGFLVRLAGWEWNYFWQWNLWLTWAGAAAALLVLCDAWPKALTPRRKSSRVAVLGAVLFGIGEIALSRYLHAERFPEPVYLWTLFVFSFGGAFYLMRGDTGRDALSRLGGWLRGGRFRGLGWFAFALGAAASAIGWQTYFGGFNQMVDSISQLSQARLLRLGHWTLDVPRPLRDAINFPSAVTSVPSYSQFPPGYLVCMLPVLAVGLPIQTLNILAGGGIALVTASLARRLGGRVAGLAAAVLIGLSPFFIALAGTAMNHAPACLALLVAAWCFLPVGPAPNRIQMRARALLGGLMLGWAATMRPLSALAHGLAWCGVWGVLIWTGWRRRPSGERTTFRLDRAPASVLRRVVLTGLALLPAMIFFLYYNNRTTGDALVMPYTANNPELHRLGFGAGGPHPFTPRNAVDNFVGDLFSFNFLLLGWAIGSWLPAVPWWLRTRLGRGERIILGLIGMQVLLYGVYRYHHLVLGPRFWFEVYPFIVILLAMGTAPALRRGGRRAGALAAVVLWLSLWGAVLGRGHFWQAFEPGAIRHRALEEFMDRHLPFTRPTVVVFDPLFIDTCGRYFPHDPGQPEIWFVEKKNEARARALPELADCDWIYLEATTR